MALHYGRVAGINVVTPEKQVYHLSTGLKNNYGKDIIN